MTIVPFMWAVWILCALLTAVLYVYRSRIERDEDGQIFLDESFNHEKEAQMAIVSRVNKVQPALHAALWATAAMSAVVIAYYIVDILRQFK